MEQTGGQTAGAATSGPATTARPAASAAQAVPAELARARDALAAVLPVVRRFQQAFADDPASVDKVQFIRALKLLERAIAACRRWLTEDDRRSLDAVVQMNARQLGAEPLFEPPDFPLSVNIQLTNRCNLKCIMCTHDRLTVKRGHMDFALVTRLLDEIARYPVQSISLQNFGESLLYPRLVDAVRHAVGHGIPIRLVTNGVLLDAAIAEQLIDAGLQRIALSVEGYTAERYEAIRRGARFQRVVDNVAALRRIRDRRGSSLRIEMHTELYDEGPEFKEAYEAFWGPHCDEFSYAGLTLFPGITYLDRDGAEVRFDGEPTYRPTPCGFPFRFTVVKVNGDVVPCCVDQNHDHVLGNVAERSLQSIWQGDAYARLRSAARTGHYADTPLCRTCSAMIARD